MARQIIYVTFPSLAVRARRNAAQSVPMNGSACSTELGGTASGLYSNWWSRISKVVQIETNVYIYSDLLGEGL